MIPEPSTVMTAMVPSSSRCLARIGWFSRR